jgi:hypothetical protein
MQWMQLMVESEPDHSNFWRIFQMWMDILDKNKMQFYYLMMNNAPIHTPAKVRDLVEGRHYRYLPPYSPFLNPTEEFWAKSQGLDKTKCFDI